MREKKTESKFLAIIQNFNVISSYNKCHTRGCWHQQFPLHVIMLILQHFKSILNPLKQIFSYKKLLDFAKEKTVIQAMKK